MNHANHARPAAPAALPFLPATRAEMDALGWDRPDVVIVTGDAYVDHPSFGMAIIGRQLEALGLRVAILAQPDWRNADAFRTFGQPSLFFGITAGNMDSMVNHYTSERRLRHDDAYTPGGNYGQRPDRAAIVYAQRAREAYRDTPLILGGIEASLRRLAHYDYWSDKVRRSILLDAKADLLLYGNAERALAEVARRLAAGEKARTITDVPGIAVVVDAPPEGWAIADARADGSFPPGKPGQRAALRLPSFEEISAHPDAYARTSRQVYLETNPYNARALIQRHGDKDVWVTPPPLPLSTAEMDRVYDLPYARAPHPMYGSNPIPAWDMIRFSVQIVRGCFGGCSFCSITAHEGRVVQSRSEASIEREIEAVRDKTAGFTGTISDLGGPTANMWRLGCTKPEAEASCRRLSCLYPKICVNLGTDQTPLIGLYRRARKVRGVKKVLVASGLRYDLAALAPDYVRELAEHHIGGRLKIAPEHTEPGPLACMMKPGLDSYDRFKESLDRAALRRVQLIPYFIAAHPGTTDQDMLALALWLKAGGFKLDQVQTFLPSPMALSSAMYHSGRNPLTPGAAQPVYVPKGERQRRLHKAFLRYHDPENGPILRDALKRMGRADLIGTGPRHLVPPGADSRRNGPPAARAGTRTGTKRTDFHNR